MNRLAAFVSALLTLSMALTAMADSNSDARAKLRQRLRGLSEITVEAGAREVTLAGIGRKGKIVGGYFNNGNAHGHLRYMVLMRSELPGRWDIVPIKNGHSFDDTITASPFQGEQRISTVRFYNGSLDRSPATFMVVAKRDLAKVDSLIDPAPVEISVFGVFASDDSGPEWYFDIVGTFRTANQYCNADAALWRELSLRLPADYSGPNRTNGCIEQN